MDLISQLRGLHCVRPLVASQLCDYITSLFRLLSIGRLIMHLKKSYVPKQHDQRPPSMRNFSWYYFFSAITYVLEIRKYS